MIKSKKYSTYCSNQFCGGDKAKYDRKTHIFYFLSSVYQAASRNFCSITAEQHTETFETDYTKVECNYQNEKGRMEKEKVTHLGTIERNERIVFRQGLMIIWGFVFIIV